MTLKRETCNSLPWNKARAFRTPILCPNMDKNKIEAARKYVLIDLVFGMCLSDVKSHLSTDN